MNSNKNWLSVETHPGRERGRAGTSNDVTSSEARNMPLTMVRTVGVREPHRGRERERERGEYLRSAGTEFGGKGSGSPLTQSGGNPFIFSPGTPVAPRTTVVLLLFLVDVVVVVDDVIVVHVFRREQDLFNI